MEYRYWLYSAWSWRPRLASLKCGPPRLSSDNVGLDEALWSADDYAFYQQRPAARGR